MSDGGADGIVSMPPPQPQTPLLGPPRTGPPRRNSSGFCSNLSRGKVIVLVTLAVVAILVAAIIILSVRSEEAEVETAAESKQDAGLGTKEGLQGKLDSEEAETGSNRRMDRMEESPEKNKEGQKGPCPTAEEQSKVVESLDPEVVDMLTKLSKLLKADGDSINKAAATNQLQRVANDHSSINDVVADIIKSPDRLTEKIESMEHSDRARAKEAIKAVHDKYQDIVVQNKLDDPMTQASTDRKPVGRVTGNSVAESEQDAQGQPGNSQGQRGHEDILSQHAKLKDSHRTAFKRAIALSKLYKNMLEEPVDKDKDDGKPRKPKDDLDVYVVTNETLIRGANDNEFLEEGDEDDSEEESKVTFGNIKDDLLTIGMESVDLSDSLFTTLDTTRVSLGDKCLDTELKCANSRGCYLAEQKCDRYVQCQDNSDEKDCTCKQYLDNAKLCDGYEDCPGGEDEQGCGCDDNEFSCSPYEEVNQCEPRSKVCDNVEDCDNGADELGCAVLSPFDEHLHPDTAESMHVKGLLYWKVGGSFHPLSLHMDQEDTAQAFFNKVAKDTCKSIAAYTDTNVPSVELVRYDGLRNLHDLPRIAHLSHVMVGAISEEDVTFPGARFEIDVDETPQESCLLAMVDCGAPVCGIRRRTEGMGTKIKKAEDYKVNKSGVEDRIVGGEDSYNWPSIVAIYRDGELACGGTIVADQWILTAAHCMREFKEKEYYYDVVAGMIRKSSSSPVTHSRHIVEVYIHPDAEFDKFSNDIALVKVNKPFVMSAHTMSACLPPMEEFKPTAGETCYTAGWGNAWENRDPSEALQEVEIPIMDKCRREYNNNTMQVCGGKPTGGADACQGDSGGPLFCKLSEEPERYYLAGVISHGEGCGRPESPGVYTRVYAYMDWIQETMQEFGDNTKLAESSRVPLTKCMTHYCDHHCLRDSKTCDQRVDCFDASDENCTMTSEGVRQLVEPKTNDNEGSDFLQTIDFGAYGGLSSVGIRIDPDKRCRSDQFQCVTTRECIPKSKRCDGKTADCKDYSDEYGCKCQDYLEENYKCDSHADCYNWGDEGYQCNYCGSAYDDETWYCHLSKQCIKKSQVCDTKFDCKYKEDEQYCINLINSPSIYVRQDGRPVTSKAGLVVFNENGHWFPACVESWNEELNDKICSYLGYRASAAYTLVSKHKFSGFAGRKLTVRYYDSQPVYNRHRRDTTALSLFNSFELSAPETDLLDDRRPRAAASPEDSCYLVSTTCSDSSSCGTMRLYSQLGSKIPTEPVPGLFPWQINLYANGKYICGGTLIQKYWVLTHVDCAAKLNFYRDYIVARAGQFRDRDHFSAYNQVRPVVHKSSVDGTKIALLLVDKSFDLNEYVNIICLPSVTWIPVWSQCYITGRAQMFLNYQFKTQVRGVCPDIVDDNDYRFCTKQTHRTNFCMDNWSGALVCPDSKGTFYAIGTFFRDDPNCKEEDPPERFETLVSPRAREGIMNIISSTSPTAYRPTSCLTHRCPLGECLAPEKVCNLFPDCADGSDEEYEMCERRKPESCKAQGYGRECVCEKDSEFKCDNSLCVTKTKYCNGKNDCGDNSDEPSDCKTSCVSLLKYLHPKKLCDGKIDCVHANTDTPTGGDEGNKTCCTDQDMVRCVEGHLHPLTDPTGNSLLFEDRCIPKKNTCTPDCYSGLTCFNGAEKQNCVVLWPSKIKGLPPLQSLAMATDKDSEYTVFGHHAHYVNDRNGFEGFLSVVRFGKKFVYCAPSSWEANKERYGLAFCDYKQQVLDRTYTFGTIGLGDTTKTFVGQYAGRELLDTEANQFEDCLLVYIKCSSVQF